MNKSSQQELNTKVKIKTKDIEITTKGYDSNSTIKIINTIFKKLNLTIDENVEKDNESTEEVNLPNDIAHSSNNKSNEESLVESINLHEIKDKIRLPRASSNFRCPHCAQAFITKVFSGNNTQWIFRDATNDTPIAKGISVADIVIKDMTDKEELIRLYDALSELTFEKVMLLYDETQTAYCPVCSKTDTLTNWMDAYSSPLNFFDSLNKCDICGDNGSIAMTEISSYTECANNCLSKAKGLIVPSVD